MEKKNIKINIIENIIVNNIDIIAIIYMIKYILIIKFFSQINNNIFDFYYFQISKISLKIRGIGESTILGNLTSDHFQSINYLNEVYINGIKQDTIAYKYYFNQTNNFVELIWKDNLNDCQNMFMKCTNITEFDLSHFDTSLVTSMARMFRGCSSLTSLDLSNFNTSLIEEMNGMFRDCPSLSSLNLATFTISSVIKTHDMFHNSINLEYIIIFIIYYLIIIILLNKIFFFVFKKLELNFVK